MDEKIIFYIVGAIIYYFIKNKRKQVQKKSSTSSPKQSNRPTIESKRKSFEELLKEISDQTEQEVEKFEEENPVEATEYVSKREEEQEIEYKSIESQSRRKFADEESRAIYEKSIKQAEGFDIAFEENENYHSSKLKTLHTNHQKNKKNNIAEEIRKGLSGNGAKKAVIYSEILNRKF